MTKQLLAALIISTGALAYACSSSTDDTAGSADGADAGGGSTSDGGGQTSGDSGASGGSDGSITTEAGTNHDASALKDAGSDGGYFSVCSQVGNPGDCGPGYQCVLFKGKNVSLCTKSCTGPQDCPPPSKGCGGNMFCSPP